MAEIRMPSVLDCTIRDGGHLTKWNFDHQIVKDAFFAAQKSGVEYFEVGYKYPPESTGLGDFAICDDGLLNVLLGTKGQAKLTVMIDAGKCRVDYFNECRQDKTLVEVVRIAAYPHELNLAFSQAEALLDMGYEVFLNLMASSELKDENLLQLDRLKFKDKISGLCFADSFGSFIPNDVSQLVNKLNKLGYERLGFHPHNNLQMAFANTLKAIEEGVGIIDASIFGMGRGSGNLPIEVLMGYFERNGVESANVVPYLDVIQEHFINLKSSIKWGYSLPGLLSGLANVHPYYLDYLFDTKQYTLSEIWDALNIIKGECGISFSKDDLKDVLSKRFYVPLTKESVSLQLRRMADQIHAKPTSLQVPVSSKLYTKIHAGRKFLIVANGPTTEKYKKEILNYIENNNCVTIGTNNLHGIIETDYLAFVSRKRFKDHGPKANNTTILVPSFFGEEFVRNITSLPFHEFDCLAPSDALDDPVVEGTQHCTHLNVAISAILLAYQMGASEIAVVGMDGYRSESDKSFTYFYDENNIIDDKETASYRYELLATELNRVSSWLEDKSIPFFIVTPTSHRAHYKPTF